MDPNTASNDGFVMNMIGSDIPTSPEELATGLQLGPNVQQALTGLTENGGTTDPQLTSQDFMDSLLGTSPGAGDLRLQEMFNKYYRGPVAPNNTTNQDYMPGLGDPILKGTYSGKSFTAPIFVASGGYLPFAAFDKRQHAMRQAAGAKLKAMSDFKVEPPQTSPQYQKRLNEEFYGGVNQWVDYATKKHGAAGLAMLESDSSPLGRQYHQWLANMEALGTNVEDMVGTSNEIITNFQQGDTWTSPESYQASIDLVGATNQMGETIFTDKDIASIRTTQRQYYSLDKALKSYWAESIESDKVFQGIEAALQNQDYDAVLTLTEEYLSDERAYELADQFYNSNPVLMSEMERAGAMDRDRLAGRMQALLGNQVTPAFKIAKKGASTRVSVSTGPNQKKGETFHKTARTLADNIHSVWSGMITHAQQTGQPTPMLKANMKTSLFNATVKDGNGNDWKMFRSIPEAQLKGKMGSLRKSYNAVAEIALPPMSSRKTLTVNKEQLHYHDPNAASLIMSEPSMDVFEAAPGREYLVWVDENKNIVTMDDMITHRAQNVVPAVVVEMNLLGPVNYETGEEDKKKGTSVSAFQEYLKKNQDPATPVDKDIATRAYQIMPLDEWGTVSGLDANIGRTFHFFTDKTIGVSSAEQDVPQNQQVPVLNFNTNFSSPGSGGTGGAGTTGGINYSQFFKGVTRE